MKATRVRALSVMVHKDALKIPSYLVLVEFFMEDGTRKRYRRTFPSRDLAERIRADMDSRRYAVLDCFNRGVEYVPTFDVEQAYSEWLRTLSMEDRVNLVRMSPMLAAQRDPEANEIVVAQRIEARQSRDARRKVSRAARRESSPVARSDKAKQLPRVGSISVLATKGRSVCSWMVEFDVFDADGKRNRRRRMFPTKSMAEIVRQDMNARRDYLLECFKSGVEFQPSCDLESLYAAWRATMSMDERIRLCKLSPIISRERDPEAYKIVIEGRLATHKPRNSPPQSEAARAARAEAHRLRRSEAAERKQRSAEEKAEAKRHRLALRDERRAEKHRLKEYARQQHMQHRAERRAEQTAQERAAAQERGLQAKARWEAKQRERNLSSLERQAEIQRGKELAAARAEEVRRQRQAEQERRRLAKEQEKMALKRQRQAQADAERQETLKQADARREAIRRAKLSNDSEELSIALSMGISLEGAEVLEAFCKDGLLTTVQAYDIVRLDADPREVEKSLKALASSTVGMPESERRLCMGNLISGMKLAYKPIPVGEHATRWALRKWAKEVWTDSINQRAAEVSMPWETSEAEDVEEDCCVV